MKKQIVSFLCPSFNHESYVKYFLDSLLAQTNPNWELILVDDCSSDNNVSEINKYKDKRIKLVQNPFNMGINCGINEAFRKSSGEILTLCASDDILCVDYVEVMLKTAQQNPDINVFYTDLLPMDEKNNITSYSDYRKNFIGNKKDILQKLFFSCNCMLSPGMAIRRNAFQELFPLPISLSIYQDYKMHIDLLLRNKFIVLDSPLVKYRKPNKNSGFSFANDITERRCKLEESLLMDSFLQINDIEKLKEVFDYKKLKQFEPLDSDFISYYLGMLALQAETEYKQVWGYNQIVKFINDKKKYELLNKRYGFCYKDFINLAAFFNECPFKRKYIKYKSLFNGSCVLVAILVIGLLMTLL